MKKYLFFFIFIAISFEARADEKKDSYHPEIDESIVATKPNFIQLPDWNPSFADIQSHGNGYVIVKFVVTKEGKVVDPVVVKSVPKGVYDKAALTAIKENIFNPATDKNGNPIDYITTQKFSVSDKTPENINPISLKMIIKCLEQIEKGQNDKVIARLSKLINQNFKSDLLFSTRGLAYINKGDYSMAMSDFNQAIVINPNNAIYYLNRGNVYTSLKDYENANNDFTKAIALNRFMLEAYFNRGIVLMKTGKYQAAIMDYSNVISIDEKNVNAYNERGYCYVKLNNISDGCLDFKKACNLGDCKGYKTFQKAGLCHDDGEDISKRKE
jgi:TonB family protein